MGHRSRYYLAEQWKNHAKKINIGGVAIDGESKDKFIAGKYVKKGVTITSRGCINKCSFCLVNKNLIEFDDFPEGNIINDNNILACSDKHIDLVFNMLKKQKNIQFKGGLESRRLTKRIVEKLRTLKITELWLACDNDSALKPLKKAVDILYKAGFKRYQIHCYALIYGKNLIKEEERLKEIYNIGARPFAQLYQPPIKEKIQYSQEARNFQRKWCRPAAYEFYMKSLKKL